MSKASELFDRVTTAVVALQSARQAHLQAQATAKAAADALAAAEQELAAARTAADDEIDIAIGKKPRPIPVVGPPVVEEPVAVRVLES